MGKQTELIFVPFPIQGHLLVTIEFAKYLINFDPRIHSITLLHWKLPYTPHADIFARSLIASEHRITLTELPDVHDPPPFELFTQAPETYMVEFVTKMLPIFRDALLNIVSSRNGSDSIRVAGLVLDFFCAPLIDVALELNLPSYIFLTCNAGFLGMMKYLQNRHRTIPCEIDQNRDGDELQIPGFVNSVPLSVLPPGLLKRECYESWIELAKRFPDAMGILVNSFAEVEHHAFDHFNRLENYPTVYPIGPVLSLEDRPSPDLDPTERGRIMRWLEDQPESSVVFLCFGSMGLLGAPQLKEIANALELVGCRFLWSIRTKPLEKTSPYDLLPDGFTDRVAGRGVVCGWAPQFEVLGHRAVGGFVSHCGWNSILESLWFGVPIATWPMYAEQQMNAFTMTMELGLAVELKVDYVSAHGDHVTAEEIVKAIRGLMDGGNSRREKVKMMKEAARLAVIDNGSSFKATATFLEELLGE